MLAAMRTGLPAGLLLLLVAAASPTHAAGHCKVTRYGVMPVTMMGTRPVLSGTINGQAVHLVADSGAFFSMISADAARRLGLRLSELPFGLEVHGVGGEERAKRAIAREFTLEGLGSKPIKDIEFIVGGNVFSEGIDGVLGQNVLGFADTEYDLANGHILLMKADDCRETNLAYWSKGQDVGVLSFEPVTAAEPHLIARAQLNGKTIRVMLDTGASTSMLALDAAERAGFDRNDPKVTAGGLVHGVGTRSPESWIARFDDLDLGGEEIRHAQLRVAKFDLGIGADMLLGADFFLSHHLYVARGQRRIYFTFNGGHVFDLGRHDTEGDNAPAAGDAAPATPATPAAAAAPAGTPPAATRPADAADVEAAAMLRRRASAEEARGEVRAAKHDLDEAIRKDPANAAGYHQRALVGFRLGEGAPALADLDHALELDPALVEARMRRAELRLRAKDAAGAEADFAAAVATSPTDSGLALRVAEAQLVIGDPARGLALLDAWIAAHGDDGRLPEALNERCWQHAMDGVELEHALEDCNKAIRRGGRNSATLDSRGLVWLRLGKYANAIDDYSAAVKLQAKNPSSLYGLGLAQLRAGQKAQGEARLAEARALDKGIAGRFGKMGLAP